MTFRSTKKKRLRKCHSQEVPLDLMTKCNVIRWVGFWNSRGHSIKTKGTGIKYGLQLIIMYQYWSINHDKLAYQFKILIIGKSGCGIYGNLL